MLIGERGEEIKKIASRTINKSISSYVEYLIIETDQVCLTFFVVNEVGVGDVEDQADVAGLVVPHTLHQHVPPLPLKALALAAHPVLPNTDVGPHPLLEPDPLPPRWELTACTVKTRVMASLIANYRGKYILV